VQLSTDVFLTEFTWTACDCRVRQLTAGDSQAADCQCSTRLNRTSCQASSISQHIADKARHAWTALV